MQNTTRAAVAEDVGRAAVVLATAGLADLVAVAIFVTVGRISHEDGLSFSGLVDTAWPFVVGVAGGYVGIALTRWPVLSLRGGAVILIKTLVIGLVLRYGVAREGTPFAFVVVTIVVLTAFILGWRLLTRAVLRRARPDRS